MSEDKAQVRSKHEGITQAHRNLDRAITKLEELRDRITSGEKPTTERPALPDISLAEFLNSSAGSINDWSDRIGKAVAEITELLF